MNILKHLFKKQIVVKFRYYTYYKTYNITFRKKHHKVMEKCGLISNNKRMEKWRCNM